MNSLLFGINLLVLFLLYLVFNNFIYFTVSNVYQYLFELYLSKPNLILLVLALVFTIVVFMITGIFIIFILVSLCRFLPLFTSEYYIIKKLSDLLFKVFSVITCIRLFLFADIDSFIPIIIGLVCGFGIYHFNLSFSTMFDQWAIRKEQK